LHKSNEHWRNDDMRLATNLEGRLPLRRVGTFTEVRDGEWSAWLWTVCWRLPGKRDRLQVAFQIVITLLIVDEHLGCYSPSLDPVSGLFSRLMQFHVSWMRHDIEGILNHLNYATTSTIHLHPIHTRPLWSSNFRCVYHHGTSDEASVHPVPGSRLLQTSPTFHHRWSTARDRHRL
jgi:hypothetical protein